MNPSPATASDPRAAKTFPQLVRAAGEAYGDDVAITLTGESIPDDSISFREIDRRSAELARGLIARGVGKGTRVGFIFGNSPSFAVTLAAIARIGAIAIPISTMIRLNELVRVLRQSDVSGLILQRKLLGKDYVERICEALPELAVCDPDLRLSKVPFLRWVVSSGDALPAGVRDIGYLAEGAASVGDDLLREAEAEVATTDQMIEIYTSGSMALPKGVKHLHGPVLFRTHYMARMLNLARGQRIAPFMPMFWVGGLMMWLLPNWEAGATTTCTEGTSTDSRIAMGSVLADEDLAKIKGPKPWWGLGMSETLGPYSYGDDFRAPGYPVCAPMDHFADGYEVRIADEHDQPVAVGEVGELQIRGYPVTPGLHKVEREGYWTADGFFHTGDMCLAEGSRVHFVGRGGDMIKTAGSNVSPAEVEMELQALDGVHSAYVVGLPDPQRGQIVAAAVVPVEGRHLDVATIEKDLRARLSSYKVPRKYVQISRDEVPMLPSNKVAKREIAELIERRWNALHPSPLLETKGLFISS
ncbi:MAG: class I adenylate-forming enzyme family protein [Novosphingobium sp.]